jgi:predicted DNA-binding protein (MmcQ/YjbR family)
VPRKSDPLKRLRALCLDLPEATEKEAWGTPTFRVRDKKMFAMYADNHHGDGRVAVWVKAPPGAQDMLVKSDSDRYFVPPYMGPSGWVGVRLDLDPDWDDVGGLLEEAYRLVAPRKLIALLDEE